MNNVETYIELDEEQQINLLYLIGQQDIRQLRNLPLHTYNLNYLIEDKEIQFDRRISPLLCACYVGKLDIIIMLLNNDRVDVNLQSDTEGYSPLMVACFKGYYEITRMLLEKNADPRKPNNMNQAPILFCFSRLEENYYKYENKKICMMLLDLLLSKGSDVNVRIDNKLGYTILMKLASSDIQDKDKLATTLEIIQFLIERGADISIKSLDSKTIFDVIKRGLYIEDIVEVLKNSKQTIFYDEEKNIKQKLESPVNKTNRSVYKFGNIIIETSEMRMNCCMICINNNFLNFSLDIFLNFKELFNKDKLNYIE